eukprot:14107633-Heterocapsa_arctica.AAC.1
MENTQELALKKRQSSELKSCTKKNGTGFTKTKRHLILDVASRRRKRIILRVNKKKSTKKTL